ncbi:DUF3307 domain-containing protein [Desertibacillus haloalkaliphilus]|uniref:DUF3307 domain-containing protein n=1 Tax=Desertibacillus haloalkaliphilus TaxID=1328930 RepID=UPI001C26F68A|nr:DUF3307 domain-containing protein [Desertibacillus haloalkaliphilus]MBU8905922.1 DUF3307 domain-containing protein [Desertibacillus haloalkaliphilus]
MTPFGMLVVAHLIGDFLFQTSWMAMYKATKWLPLLSHCLVYTVTVALIDWFSFGALSISAILFIFITHVLLDRRTFVQWWLRNIMKTTGKEAGWLGIVVDQIFHIIVLALALLLSSHGY